MDSMGDEAKRNRKNLLERERRARKKEAIAVSQILQDARAEAAEILRKGREDSILMLSDAEKTIQELNEDIQRREAALTMSAPSQAESQISDPVARRRALNNLAAKKSYWKKKAFFLQNLMTGTGPGEVSSIPNRGQRSMYSKTFILVSVFKELSKGLNVESQKKLMKTFWNSSSLRGLQPSLLGDPRIDRSISTALLEVKRHLAVVKNGRRTDHRATKHAILTAFSGDGIVGNRQQTAIARALGVHRLNIYKATKKRGELDADPSVKFPMGERKTRSDKISAEVKAEVQKFWETRTRVSPNQKDTCRKRIGRKQYETHQVHWLEETEVDFFLSFQECCAREGVVISIGLRSFQAFKPFYVRKMKDRSVCCCKQHVEMDLLKEALSKYRIHSHPIQCECTDCYICNVNTYDTCDASKQTITSVRGWCEEILCPKEEGQQWHKKACLKGKCSCCGISKLRLCRAELLDSPSNVISWHAFEYASLPIPGKKLADGKQQVSKRLRMVYKSTSVFDFFEKVKVTMPQFVKHNFRARWQGEQYRQCLATFQPGTIVSNIDFAENYTFKIQNKVQSMHWDNKQITILVLCTYRHQSTVATTDVERDIEERNIVADYHFYISDDRKHDTLFVQHCLDLQWKWMVAEGISCTQHIMWSDGCAAQFKACRPFYFVSRYFNKYGAPMLWCFHGSGHGKGVHDGLGGTVKSALEAEELKGLHGHKLQNAHDAVEFCKIHFQIGKQKEYGGIQEARRFFWEIEADAVDRKTLWDCLPLSGTRLLHTFYGFSQVNPTLLQVRELSCFCEACVEGNFKDCFNVSHAGKWKLRNVDPKRAIDAHAYVEALGPGDGLDEDLDCQLADFITIGDFFAVEAVVPNAFNNANFYVLQCTKTVHTVETSFTDAYKVRFNTGDTIVQGRWYQQYGKVETCFIRNDDASLSFVHAESVVHIRFALLPTGGNKGSPSFRLPSDTLEAIMSSLRRCGALEDD